MWWVNEGVWQKVQSFFVDLFSLFFTHCAKLVETLVQYTVPRLPLYCSIEPGKNYVLSFFVKCC